MEAIYDPILGKMRATDAAISKMMKGNGLILHLPLRENAEDCGANKIQPSGEFTFTDGWASADEQVYYDLSAFELNEISMTGNLIVLANGDLFGIESNSNTFFWEKRYGNSFVMETMNGSFDFNIAEAGSGVPFHISAVYDGNMLYCYLNGILLESEHWDLRFSNAFFKFWRGSRYSDIRFYETALNAAEIHDIYQQDRRV